MTDRFVFSSQQEEKDRETPKDSLDDLFPNDEEEHGQGSKRTGSIPSASYDNSSKKVCCHNVNVLIQSKELKNMLIKKYLYNVKNMFRQ